MFLRFLGSIYKIYGYIATTTGANHVPELSHDISNAGVSIDRCGSAARIEAGTTQRTDQRRGVPELPHQRLVGDAVVVPRQQQANLLVVVSARIERQAGRAGKVHRCAAAVRDAGLARRHAEGLLA